MNKHSVAAGYERYRQEALELAEYFSGAHWRIGNEHDPGLTLLELLANAVALIRERYDDMPECPAAFHPLEDSGRWIPRPDHPDALVFLEKAPRPGKAAFEAVPSGRDELCRCLRRLPGVARAWLLDAGSATGGPQPEAVLEFAPVLFVGGAAYAEERNRAEPENPEQKAPLPEREKRRVLDEAAALLRRVRGVCQPVPPVREARLAPLRAEFVLDLGTGADVPACVARILRICGDVLRPSEQPLRSVSPAQLRSALPGRLPGPPAADVPEAVSVRLSLHGQSVAGHGTLCLPEGHDGFCIADWSVSARSGGVSRPLSGPERQRAVYLALLPERNSLSGPASSGRAEPRPEVPLPETPLPAPGAGKPDRTHLHEQFPACYGLNDPERRAGPEETAAVRQFQGWLLLLEQLLADWERPLDNSELFSPRPAQPEDWNGEMNHPLLPVLTDAAAWRQGLAEAEGESGAFAARRRGLLLYLAALQGEAPWFSADWASGGDAAGYDKMLASWLRRLPCLNGRRLLRGRGPLPGMAAAAQPGPLEERLSLVLLPFDRIGREPVQRLFDLRRVSNPLTARDEYRCFIRDESGRLRLACRLCAGSPEEAERTGLLALRLAALPAHYRITPCGIRIGPQEEPALAELAPAEGIGDGKESEPDPAERIREAVRWARGLLPPWLKVLEYAELGEDRPCEIAVLIAAEAVPGEVRARVEEALAAQIPAHILPHFFWISEEEREKFEALLYPAEGADYPAERDRCVKLLELLAGLSPGAF